LKESFVAAASAVLLLAAGCGEKGRPEPGIRMAISHDPTTAAEGSGTAAGAPKAPARLVVPHEVEKAYSAIRLNWKDSTSSREGTLDVPLGGSARIPDSEIEVRAGTFLPAFTMSGDQITSSGIEATNPAALISVSEKGNEIFGGWLFTNFPDAHPFQHPRYSLRLAGGVKRGG
jgi:hypothetical protein